MGEGSGLDPDDALGGLARGHNFAVVIMAAMAADMVRTLQLAAIATFGMGFRTQSQMATAHASARRRGFTFWNGHS